MPTQHTTHRRQFLQHAGAFSAAIAVAGLSSRRLNAQSVSGRAEQWRRAIERPGRLWDYDGQRILGHLLSTARLFDATDGKFIQRFESNRERMYCSQLSPDGRHVATSSWMDPHDQMIRSKDTRITLWDSTDGTIKHEFAGEVFGEFNPDGTAFVSFSEKPGELPPHTGRVNWASTGEFWETGPLAPFEAASVWSTSTGERISRAMFKTPADPRKDRLHFSPDGRSLVYLRNVLPLNANEQSATLYDVADGSELRHLGTDAIGYGVHRFVSDNRLASVTDDHATVIELQTGRKQYTVPIETEDLWGSVWTHDGTKVITVSNGGALTLLDIASGKQLPIIDLPTPPRLDSDPDPIPFLPHAAIISPDNRHLAIESGSEGEAIELRYYDLEATKQIAVIKLPAYSHIVGFAPDSKTLLIGGTQFVVMDAEDARSIRTLQLFTEDFFYEDWLM